MASYRIAILALFSAAVAPTAALLRGTEQNDALNLDSQLRSLSSMHPDVVGRLLAEVQKHWEESRVSVFRNRTDSQTALAEMTKSCTKVSKAIVDGSDGDKPRVEEYMHDVCTGNVQEQKCEKFSSNILGFLRDDAEFNRDNLDFSKFCQGYWANVVSVSAKIEAQSLEVADAKEKAERVQHEKEEREKQDEQERQIAKEAAIANESHDLQEAVNLTKKAKGDEVAMNQAFKVVESHMEADDAAANKLVDRARVAEKVASEKEAKAAEAPPMSASMPNATAPDEAAALAAGDAKAEAIAEKAEKKTAAAVNATEAKDTNDEAEAIAAGDAKADAIIAKAESKTAALVALKKQGSVVALDKDMKTKMLVQVSHKVSQVDPCGGIECGDLKCPAGFQIEQVPGHCCGYCVNPAIKVEDLVTGATGEHGGKPSTFCNDVWCFPTLCTKTETAPTTTNGQCCPKC